MHPGVCVCAGCVLGACVGQGLQGADGKREGKTSPQVVSGPRTAAASVRFFLGPGVSKRRLKMQGEGDRCFHGFQAS